jgi:L-iditol 2-dehydrogenase
MRALQKTGKGPDGTALCDIPIPEAVAGEVVIRVQAAAVCASDIHIFHDEFPCALPVVLGHEFTGIVHAIGEGVDNVVSGDAVVAVNNPDACGVCPACRDGYPNICPEKRAIGFKRDGCFADFVRVPAPLLHRVPVGVSPVAAALCEPLAVSVHAVEDRCGIRAGDTVVVLGPGAIGLLEAQVARAEGAARVIVAGTDADVELRLARAAELGFEICNVQRENLEERVLAVTSGYGADVVVEASGAPPAITTAIKLLRRGGRLCVSGITGREQISVPWDMLVSKAASVLFAYSSRPRNWETGLRYLAEGKVVTEPLVSHRFKLEQWREAFALMEKAGCIRGVFDLDPV